MVHRVLTTITAVALISTLIAFAPPSAQALSLIETAGDYVFTGGLTGSFTSDGTQLTTWNFVYAHPTNLDPTDPGNLDPFTIWTDTDITQVASNGEDQFVAVDLNNFANFILINWSNSTVAPFTFATPFTFIRDGQGSVILDGNGEPQNTNLPFSIAQASVPEPSSALLLLAGLVLLVGYRWRQQHSTGMQVG